jgi:hypothetical protein
VAFRELYGWYRENADDLFPINRDELAMPVGTRQARARESGRFADALIAGHGGQDRRGRTLRAVAGHLTGYWTWRSLELDQGLSPGAAVDVACQLLIAAAATPAT